MFGAMGQLWLVALVVHSARWALLRRRGRAVSRTSLIDASHPRYEATAALMHAIYEHDDDVEALAPAVFARLRGMWRCDGALRRRCRQGLVEQTGGGSRGAARRGNYFFQTSGDARYVVKQETAGAARRLSSIAEDYERHLVKNKESLLPRFVGVYRVLTKGEATYWLVMNNVFSVPGCVIGARYDLKGSTAGRLAKSATSTQKDQDALRDRSELRSRPGAVNSLLKAVKADSAFLERHHLLDYSLLVGICERPPRLVPFAAGVQGLGFAKMAPSARGIRLMPRRPRSVCDVAGPGRSLAVGLIDILQPFDIFKQFEFCFRGAYLGFDSISAAPPQKYRNRLLDFLKDIFGPAAPDAASSSSLVLS